MSRQEDEDRAPKAGVRGIAANTAGDNFAGELLVAAQPPDFSVTQGLDRRIMVRRPTGMMFHATRERDGEVQGAKTGTASEPDEPGLLPKCLRSRGKVPDGIHETGYGVLREQV